MKLITQCAVFLSALSFAMSLSVPVFGNVDLEKDIMQYNACKAADPNRVVVLNTSLKNFVYQMLAQFAGIRYGDGPPEVVGYNQCVPWRKDGKLIANAVLCQPASCYAFSDENCKSGSSVPVPVDVPVSADFLNAADFVELLGQSAYFSPNTLPSYLR